MANDKGSEQSKAWALWRRNLPIWALLVVLIAVNCGLAFVPLGPLDFPIQLSVAAIQVACIAIFSMGLRHSNVLIRCTLLYSGIFVLVMFLLTSADVVTRFANHWTR